MPASLAGFMKIGSSQNLKRSEPRIVLSDAFAGYARSPASAVSKKLKLSENAAEIVATV